MKFLSALSLLTVLSLWLSSCAETPIKGEADTPNIIVIFTDDHGYPDVGAMGIYPDVKTPNIDSLVRGGAIMKNGYVTSPTCSTSRAGLLSGRYQGQLGVHSNDDFKTAKGRNAFSNITNLAEALHTNGYKTGMAGKWHLGPGADIDAHGFDVFLHHDGRKDRLWNMNLKGEIIKETRPKAGYHVDMGARFAETFIQKYGDTPFFFYWAPRAPHIPLDAPDRYVTQIDGDMPERRRHGLAALKAVDDGVGKIMDALEEKGLAENTIIFVLGDNGASLKKDMKDTPLEKPKSWNGSMNGPLNGEKGLLLEGGIRVPFIMYWKGQIPAGTVFEPPVISLDVLATSLDSASVKKPEHISGVNLIPYLRGEESGPPHKALFWRHGYQSAVRMGNWKYIKVQNQSYLFDLSKDKGEKKNLAKTEKTTVRKLKEQLTDWSETLDPPGLISPLQDEKLLRKTKHHYNYYLDVRN